MAVQWQTVDIQLGQGQQEKIDPLLLPNGALSLLWNAEFDKLGSINKRAGYTLLSSPSNTRMPTLPGGAGLPTSLGGGYRLVNHANELSVIDGQYLWTWDQTAQKMVLRSHVPTAVGSRTYGSGSHNAADPDAAYTNGYTCIVGHGVDPLGTATSDGVRITLVNVQTGADVNTDATSGYAFWDDVVPGSAGSTCSAVRVLAVGTRFVITWLDGVYALMVNVYDTATGTWFYPSGVAYMIQALVGHAGTGPHLYDSCTVSANYFAVAAIDATHTVTNVYELGIYSGAVTPDFTGATADPPTTALGIGLCGTNLVVCWSDAGGFCAQAFSTASLATTCAQSSPFIAFSGAVVDCGVSGIDATHFVVTAQIGGNPNEPIVSTVQHAWVQLTPPATMIWTMMPSQGFLDLLTKPYYDHDLGRAYVVVQPQLPGTGVGGTITAIGGGGLGGGVTTTASALGAAPSVHTGCILVELPKSGADATNWRPHASLAMRSTKAGGRADYLLGNLTQGTAAHSLIWGHVLASGPGAWGTCAFEAHMESTATNARWSVADTTDGAAIGIGTPSLYDGAIVHEAGFISGPELFISAHNAGGAFPPGNYVYSAVVSWKDRRGNTHYSTTAQQSTVVIPAGGVDYVNVYVYLPTLTAKGNHNTPFVVTLYRGQVNDPILHAVGSKTYTLSQGSAWTGNGATAAPIYWQDTGVGAQFGDDAIAKNAKIYTDGGYLDHYAPPSANIAITHCNRVWLAGCDDPTVVYYSGQLTTGWGVWFSDEFAFRLDDGGGAVTGLASLDDKLIIFKRNRIYLLSGQGPSDAGSDNDFTRGPEPLTSDVGCIDHRSIVVIPDGVVFRAAKGFYLLTRKLQVTWIGQAVVDTANTYSTVLSAVRVEGKPQVRFLCLNLNNGSYIQLMYDYLVGQWATWSLMGGANIVSGVVSRGTYYALKDDGTLYSENSTHLDAGAFYAQIVKTGPLHVKGLQDYVRTRAIRLLGTRKSAHSLTITATYDYDPARTETQTWSDSDLQGLPIEQVRFCPATQKMEAIQLQISDAADGSSPAEGFILSGLSLEVGLKQTGYKRLSPGATR